MKIQAPQQSKPGEDPSAEPLKIDWKRKFPEHPALVLTGIFIAIAILRVVLVARDPVTALAILPVVDRTSLLVSTATQIALSTTTLLIVYPPAFEWIAKRSNAAKTFTQSLGVNLIFAVVAVFMLTSITPFVLLLAIAARIAWWDRKRRARKRGALTANGLIVVSPTRFEWSNWFAAIFTLSALTSILATPWTPREVITFPANATPPGVQQVNVGYVIGESSRQLLVLNPSNRVDWLPSFQIERRWVCSEPGSGWLFESLGKAFARSKYETCPQIQDPTDPTLAPPGSPGGTQPSTQGPSPSTTGSASVAPPSTSSSTAPPLSSGMSPP